MTTPEHDERIAQLKFGSVYPHYVAKVEKKGRTEDELLEIISWLTSFDSSQIKEKAAAMITFQQFFSEANIHPNAQLIKGSICGYKIQEIITPLTKQVRYLDKVVDELAKGKSLEKIKRE